MDTQTQHEVDTRENAKAEQVRTNLTINWTGMSEEEIRALAAQALIVKLQGGWRKNGIPEGDFSVNASDHKIGVRAPRGPVDVFTLASKLSPEEKAKLLAKLTG